MKLYLGLFAALLLGLSGCGDSATDTPADDSSSSVASSSSTDVSSSTGVSSSGGTESSSSVVALPAGIRAEYPGAKDCGGCHPSQYSRWIESGHAYKLNRVEDGSVPLYPFSDVSPMFPHTVTNSAFPDADMTLANTGYLIGGYGWKARFIDSDGKIIHGANAQYNLATEEWGSYHDGEDHSPYACGSCHATGWDPSATNPLAPEMAGNMLYDAITCQRCHGDDTNGAAGHNPKTLTAVNDENSTDVQGAVAEFEALGTEHKANSVCAVCHVRGGVAKEVKVSSGFIKHHEQSHELLVGAGGAAHGCVTCHDPHSSVKYDDLAEGEGVTKGCADCHASKTVATEYAGHDCIDCHMPQIVKSAVASTVGTKVVDGVTTLGIPGGAIGDMRSHILSLTPTSDTAFVAATLDGAAGVVNIPVEYSCMTCHGEGGTKGPTTGAEAVNHLTATPVH